MSPSSSSTSPHYHTNAQLLGIRLSVFHSYKGAIPNQTARIHPLPEGIVEDSGALGGDDWELGLVTSA